MFAALKLYCMLGVSAQSTRLHISVHKYLFSFESGYFSVFKNIIVCALLFENVSIFYMYMAGFESFENSFSLILKKKGGECRQILSHPSTIFSGTIFLAAT